MEPLLSIRLLVKRFGAREVLRGVSLEIAQGEFLTVLGESGSGKTTLLRVVAGFEQAEAGEIWMAGEQLDQQPPHRRRVNTVFQHYALFPHLTVFENVAYGLRVQKVPKAEVAPRTEEALAMVKMSEYAQAAPAQLSGGQQQRVALARALVNRPRLLLLDEPLSALDANLRRQMQTELKALQKEVGIAFLFVTHDQEEAMALSDRIALLRAGELEQVGTPREVYSSPRTAYTAQFIGQTNLVRCEVKEGQSHWGSLAWPCQEPEGPATFSLRPEGIRMLDGASVPTDPTSVRFRATVRSQAFGGATDMLEITCADGQLLRVQVTSRGEIHGERQFEFSLRDVVRVRDAPGNE